jgi:very-short-patch-repair endonuclease
MTITQNIIKIDDHSINTINENNTLWICAKDVCKYLLYKNTKKAIIDMVSSKNIKTRNNFIQNCIANSGSTKYTNKDGLTELLLKSKLSPTKILKVARAFDIEINTYNRVSCDGADIKVLSKEQQTLDNIMNAFDGETFITQHSIGEYRIDLYLPKYKLAIECDEYDHKDRDKLHEQTREKYITNTLKCTFIRFNPDAQNFNIFNVINKIYKHINTY